MLWGPTGNSYMPCYAYGGNADPCALTVTNDYNSGLGKDPSYCKDDTFFLWDEPDTQGKNYSWAAVSWLTYSSTYASQITEMRARGVKFTTPLLKADAAATYLQEFWAACGAPCSDATSPSYIDVVGMNPFCGSWNEPAGTAEGCRNGINWVVNGVKWALGGRPLYITNWGYLGSSTTSAQVAAIEATDAFFASDFPVERVYYFGAIDYGGGTTKNMLTDTVESGDQAGKTLGTIWAEKCASL